MGLPVEVNNLMMGAVGGYQISRSLRFRNSASAYLNRTPASAGNRRTWTFSFWAKLANMGTGNRVLSTYTASTDQDRILLGDSLLFAASVGGTQYTVGSNNLFRDPSAWYHFIVAVDTTQATSNNRMRLYVNGNEVSYGTQTMPPQNTQLNINNTISHWISGYNGTSELFGGYLADVYFIDGQQLTPSSFGETDSITGVWNPKKYSGTYGTNGFYLNFSDNSGATATTIGKDSSGNGNNWTPNNISVTAGTTYDSMIDSPTPYADGGNGRGNYAVLNPISTTTAPASGNLNGTGSAPSATSTIAVSSGKWYSEFIVQTIGSQAIACGITNRTNSNNSMSGLGLSYQIGYDSLGRVNNAGTTTTGFATFTANDTIGMAVDCDAGTISFYKNNTLINTVTNSSFFSGNLIAFGGGAGGTSGSDSWWFNFGQRPFTYTPPSGYSALNTYNLPAPSIANGAQYFDTLLYTANVAGGKTISGLNFQPDLVWIKNRDNLEWHYLQDAVRGFGGAGTTKGLSSNQTDAEATIGADITFAPTSNGFTITDTNYNSGPLYFNGRTYVAWNWKAGGTGVTNTSGTITSTVSASPSSGFSIATYTGTGANATVGHGLGVAPSMIIVKQRNAVRGWPVYHSGLTSATYYIDLQTTAAQASASVIWNSTAPTSSVFSIGTDTGTNQSTGTYVAYCFSAVSGYSAFGKYTGNGSADGAFVYTGFRPRFIMWKNASFGSQWILFDTSRSTYNISNGYLEPNTSDTENTASVPSGVLDILSNGFKLRTAGIDYNDSSYTYIYAAFAENPFNISRAR